MKAKTDQKSQFLREIDFHDDWAEQTALDQIMVREVFESFTAVENQFCLHLVGSLEGKRVLDVGTGLGESAVYFALQGAKVTAVDISPGMVQQAQQLAQHWGTEIEGIVAPAENLTTRPDYYDFIYCANVLHHVTDIDTTLESIRRALKPGGLCITWDPLAYNPVINLYRVLAKKVRTEDEHPLRFSVLDLFNKHFVDVQHREFWLTTQLLFVKYFLLDRKNPNKHRYWKEIYKEKPEATERWFNVLRRIDDVLLRIPPLNYLAWNTLIWARKAEG